ncbi:Ankyrin repeat protein [Giardia duodenalis]|uniref:Ankyrin repeat protein n=1 Tax=Giardia intestinalis TaxID=5741 RepID=V6T9N4_GIAIN|nr:Ankyrin repeat protein [Giardia intestinalis]
MLAAEFRKLYCLSEPIEVSPHIRTYDAVRIDGPGTFTYLELCYAKAFQISVLPTLDALEDFQRLRHPSIVPILEIVYDPSSGIVGILVEQITDMTLRDLMDDFIRHKLSLPEEQVWDIVAQVVKAMQYCHLAYKPGSQNLRRVIHRCLHPNNIFVSASGTVRVGFPELSFLLGCIKASDLSPGIQRYLAPEVIAEQTVSDKSDVWSMGVIFYELCTLTPLLPLLQGNELIDNINILRTHISVPGYSFDMCDVINGMLSREPLHRFSTYELLHHERIQSALLRRGPVVAQTLHQTIEPDKSALRLTAYSLSEDAPKSSSDSVEKKKAHINRLQNSRYKPEKFDAATRLYYGVTDSGDDIDLSYRGTDSVVTGKPYLQINFELKHGDTMDKYNKVHTNDSSQTRMEHNPFPDSSIQTTLPRDGTKEIAPQCCTSRSKSRSGSRASGRSKSRKSESRSLRKSNAKATSASSAKDQAPPAELENMIDQYVRSTRTEIPRSITTDSSTIANTMTSALVQSLTENAKDESFPLPPTITNSSYKPAAKLDSNLNLWVDDIVVNVLQKKHGYYTMDDIKNRLFEIVPGMQLEPGVSVHSPSDLIAIQILAEEVERRLEPYRSLFPSVNPSGQPLTASSTARSISDMVENESQLPQELQADRRVLKSSHPKGRSSSHLAPHERIRQNMSTLGTAHAVSTLFRKDTSASMEDGNSLQNTSITESSRPKMTTLDDYNEQKSICNAINADGWRETWSNTTYSQHVVPRSAEVESLEYTSRPIEYTNLMKAATLGDIDKVKLLISLEANITTRHGVTALMFAAAAGHLSVVETLLPYEAKGVDMDGLPALSYAVKGGHAEISRVLAPIEACIIAKNGLSPLMIACDYNQVAIVSILKEYGGRLCTSSGTTALMRAAQRNSYPLCKTLFDVEAAMQNNAGETAMLIAAKQNYVQIVELLANRENRIPNAQGTTALMIAASKNFVEIVRLLYRMESEMKDIYNETALMKAAKAGALDAAALLLEAEAGMAREDGKTAMMCAAEMDRMEMVDLLLKKECNRAMKDGTTALMLAAQKGYRRIIQLLARFEAKRQRVSGETALMLAIRHQNVDAIEDLINYEGDIDMYNGTTVEEIARLTGNPTVIRAVASRFS